MPGSYYKVVHITRLPPTCGFLEDVMNIALQLMLERAPIPRMHNTTQHRNMISKAFKNEFYIGLSSLFLLVLV